MLAGARNVRLLPHSGIIRLCRDSGPLDRGPHVPGGSWPETVAHARQLRKYFIVAPQLTHCFCALNFSIVDLLFPLNLVASSASWWAWSPSSGYRGLWSPTWGSARRIPLPPSPSYLGIQPQAFGDHK